MGNSSVTTKDGSAVLFKPTFDGLRLVNSVVVQNQEDALDLRPADVFQSLKQPKEEYAIPRLEEATNVVIILAYTAR